MSGSGCSCGGGRKLYEWRPASCRLRPWNALRFCELLRGRKLLMAGDSTMEQVSITLRNYIAWDAFSRKGHPNATCARLVHFALTDTLTAATMGRFSRGHPLVWQLLTLRPSIVLVSSGPHVYGENNFESVLRHVRDQVAPKFPRTRFIWRTQFPAGCGDHEHPLATLPINSSRFWAAPPRAVPRPRCRGTDSTTAHSCSATTLPSGIFNTVRWMYRTALSWTFWTSRLCTTAPTRTLGRTGFCLGLAETACTSVGAEKEDRLRWCRSYCSTQSRHGSCSGEEVRVGAARALFGGCIYVTVV